MSRACCWLAVLLGCAPHGRAADLSPADFASGLPVITQGDAAVYRFALPLSVYRGTVREDLGDLRMFNAQGGTVPYSLLRPTPPPQIHAAASALPLFALRGGARVVLDGARLRIDSPDAASGRQPQGSGIGSSVNQYILDGRRMTMAVAALELRWSETVADYSGRVRIESSDDLDTWQTLVTAAPTANLHSHGQVLIENRVSLPPTRARFWRVTWVGPPPPFELTSVWAQPADSPVDAVRATLEVTGTREAAEPDADTFDLGAHLPVSRINIVLPEENTVSTIELSSRRTAQDPWHIVTRSGFYRLKGPQGDERNAPIDIAVDRDRFWRARSVRGGSVPSTALRLHVEWVPTELTFLARGPAPFLLAYGNATVSAAEADLGLVPDQVTIAPASPGTPHALGGAARLDQAPPFAAGRLALWGALLLAVGSLGVGAWRLSRDKTRRNPPTSTR